VRVSVNGPSKLKNPHEQNLNVDNYVGQYEHRHVNPFAKEKPDEATGPEMIWCERHANPVSGSNG
jgi:hypothetical protein